MKILYNEEAFQRTIQNKEFRNFKISLYFKNLYFISYSIKDTAHKENKMSIRKQSKNLNLIIL